MDITTFLAQLWGPVIFAVAVGVFVSRTYYIKIYRDLEKDALAVLLFGMVAMTAGIAHVLVHNLWSTFPQIVVSLLGWGMLIKGALFIIAPNFVDRAGDGWANLKLIPFAGGLMLLIGGYLSWFAYLA
ncbi:hypothetical protein COU18_03190 [Candidatus Kaiserbacteria bacterium CG10_big_fil_rev_8_21_14_0_10_51_14]|uniref:Uncharacterized protein n=1 Tax=Candidatus Kaiserbacteria bacterium CG10_big_fil_rev_8_21_14_0_10_51_14 TaxID=1974610 RepID=A0A2H0UB79_9BACT|nr:MAG: hypothetical protein COU18_03190 [Candidatus Kaiserbacteria bacterium CG10_big_fil_rev_8_21_14_0_10_51_14]